MRNIWYLKIRRIMSGIRTNYTTIVIVMNIIHRYNVTNYKETYSCNTLETEISY